MQYRGDGFARHDNVAIDNDDLPPHLRDPVRDHVPPPEVTLDEVPREPEAVPTSDTPPQPEPGEGPFLRRD